MHTTPPDTASNHPRKPASLAGILSALFGAMMIALAAGAIWLLVSLSFPGLRAQGWLILPLAAVMGALIRNWVIDDRRHAVWLAVLSVLLCCAYMRILLMAIELAGSFGMPFMQAIRHAGPAMLVHLAWLSVSTASLVLYAMAALLAGLVAWRPRSPGQS